MKLLRVLRLVAVAHAVAVGLQPVLAGVYLNGSSTANRIHEPLGNAVALLCLTQLLVATIWWRTGGRLTAVLATAGILAAESVQIGMGYSRQLALHVPLGIAIVAATVALTLWMFGRAPRSTEVVA
jgi:hypothetical protein